jgi:type VI protein secretion system component VasF
VILALALIAAFAALVVLSARLRDARAELARVRAECTERVRAMEDEAAAYAHGITMSLACLMAGLAAWYAPHPAARPAGKSDRENKQ